MSKLILPTRRGLIKSTAAVLTTSPAVIRRAEAFMRGGLAVQGGGGGGFSDNDWPGPANRPTPTGTSTVTLTWVGPLGGGPNNGSPVQQMRVLANQTTAITTTAPNQIIAGLNFTNGGVTVAHNNCTVMQSNFAYAQGSNFINVMPGTTGFVCEDCSFNGLKQSYQAIAVSLVSPFQWTGIVRRCYIQGVNDGISGNPFNSSFTDNFFTAFGDTNASPFDADQIEIYHCNNLLIFHNRFDSSNSQSSGFTSANNLSNLDAVTNITIDTNLYTNNGWDNEVICVGNQFSSAALTYAFTNNGFFNTSPLAFRRTGSDAPGPTLGNSGNYIAASLTATSGALINGTGQI